MRIKGHTTIQLKDVNTGEITTYEDDNMVTNALQNFFNPIGTFGVYPMNDSDLRGSRLWKSLLGGIMLFDSNIEEDAQNTFMPAGVKMVGNGAYNVSNGSDVTELGTYNATESTEQVGKSVKFVYDFSTSQANGTINCVCLTSTAGGYIGMGNKSGYKLDDNDYSLNSYQTSCSANSKTGGLYWNTNYGAFNCTQYAVFDEDAVYIVDPQSLYYNKNNADDKAICWTTTKKIKIHKVRAGFKSVGFFDNSYINRIMQTYTVNVPADVISFVTASSGGIYTSAGAFADPFNKCIYIVFAGKYTSLDNGATLYLMKIDDNFKVTSHPITNNTGYSIYLHLDNLATNSSYRKFVFYNDYMYCWAMKDSTYTLFKININDSSDVEELECVEASHLDMYMYQKGLIAIHGGSNSHYYNRKIYDVVNNTCYPTNGYDSDDYETIVPFADKQGLYVVEDRSTNSVKYKVVKDPRYLATINNLVEPVVKTNNRTMKVIYTLTFEG